MAVVRTDWIEFFNKYVTQHYGQEDKQIPLTGKWFSQKITWISVHPVLLSLQKVTIFNPWSVMNYIAMGAPGLALYITW